MMGFIRIVKVVAVIASLNFKTWHFITIMTKIKLQEESMGNLVFH